jgi:isocitrate dehydrogenase
MRIPLFLLFLFLAHNLCAKDIAKIAKKFNLYGGQKATIQWERVFSSQRHLKRYKLDKLPLHTRDELKEYLIKHAADSDQPIVPGL